MTAIAPSRTLALFDFDGTITTKDTLLEFTRFAVGKSRYLLGMLWLGPVLVFQKVGAMQKQRAKEIFLRHFFGGWTVVDFERRCLEFDKDILPGLIRGQALKTLLSYRQEGIRTVIVSASPFHWITPWASELGIEVIGTRLVVAKDRLTGLIHGKNCNGDEKVVRIKEHVDLSQYDSVIAYGDTSGDVPMLGLATERHYKPFLTPYPSP